MGTRETLQVMAALIRAGADSPRLQDFVFRMLGEAPDPFLVDRWVRGHFRYRPDGENEIIRTPDFMLNDLENLGYIQGDCDCITVFYSTILLILGYRVRLVAIRHTDPSEFEHVFLEFYNGNRWSRVDPTVSPGTIHVELDRMVQPL